MSCVFCELPENRIIEKSSLSKVFRDAFPVTPLHTLIIPIRHVSDYFDLSQEEKADIENLLVKQKKHIMELDETPTTDEPKGVDWLEEQVTLLNEKN